MSLQRKTIYIKYPLLGLLLGASQRIWYVKNGTWKTKFEKRNLKNRIRWFLGALFSKQWFIKTDEVKDSKVQLFWNLLLIQFPSFKFVQFPFGEKIYIQETSCMNPSHKAIVWVELYYTTYLFHFLMEPGVISCLTRILSVRLILVGSCFTKNIYRKTTNNWIDSC